MKHKDIVPSLFKIAEVDCRRQLSESDKIKKVSLGQVVRDELNKKEYADSNLIGWLRAKNKILFIFYKGVK